MQLIGRNYFNPQGQIHVEAYKMNIWPGYTTSINQYENDTLLSIDVAHKVFSSETVYDFLRNLYNSTDRNRFYDMAQKKLLGAIVMTTYNNTTYQIVDIDWNKHPTDTFDKGGSPITFVEYMHVAHNIKITDMQQPMLLAKLKDKNRKSGMSGNIYVLPELCFVTGIPEDMKNNFSMMKALSEHTRVAPAARVKNYQNFMHQLNNNPECAKEMSQWNMKFDMNLAQTQGRVLNPEKIFQSQGAAECSYKQSEADWSRDMRGKTLNEAVNMSNWLLLYTQRDAKIANDFVQTLQKVGGPMGMRIVDPTRLQLKDDSARTYFSALDQNLQRGHNIQMVVCIVPNNRKDRYDAIKKLCCVEKPVPSQVIVTRTLSKQQMLMSVCTKIGIQLNCKLGGEVWSVGIPLKTKSIMAVGFDVYHDSLTKGKSIGGFVASLNFNLTKYYSVTTSQTSHCEIADQLKFCMTSALKKFHQVRGALPDIILIYRDGVGDGQLSQVLNHELPQFVEAFKELYQAPPQYAMIIVKKRISTRLILQDRQNFCNPLPGTIVDNTVTRPQWVDFFLVSQSVRQGTVTPTHYNIIRNTSCLNTERIQQMTYKLCHLYYNWPGTIRVPAPCQYAHKLAFLVGQSVHTAPHACLADRLYYL